MVLAKKAIANCKIINNECKNLLLIILVIAFFVLEKNKILLIEIENAIKTYDELFRDQQTVT